VEEDFDPAATFGRMLGLRLLRALVNHLTRD
jgi:hypothetical protein